MTGKYAHALFLTDGNARVSTKGQNLDLQIEAFVC
jgi:hypothetical protein